MTRAILPATLTLLLSGCAVGPDFVPPPPPSEAALGPTAAATADAPGGVQHFDAKTDLPAAWWQLYHAPALDRLIAEALAHNADLAAAQAALRMAREIAAANEG